MKPVVLNAILARVHLRNGSVQHFQLPPLRWPPDRVQYGGDEYALQPDDTPGAPAIYKLTGGPFRLEPHWRCDAPKPEKTA